MISIWKQGKMIYGYQVTGDPRNEALQYPKFNYWLLIVNISGYCKNKLDQIRKKINIRIN